MEYSGVFKEHHPGICIIWGLFVAKKSCYVIGFILRFIELVYNTVFLIVWVIYLKHMGQPSVWFYFEWLCCISTLFLFIWYIRIWKSSKYHKDNTMSAVNLRYRYHSGYKQDHYHSINIWWYIIESWKTGTRVGFSNTQKRSKVQETNFMNSEAQGKVFFN